MSILAPQFDVLETVLPQRVLGTVEAIRGLTIEAIDLSIPIGSLCTIHSAGERQSSAEVIGFRSDRTLLMPLSSISGVSRGDVIEGISSAPRVWCSEQLLGRVLDGFGKPNDNKGPVVLTESRRIDGRGISPLDRRNVRKPISTSVRAIDALHTCGLGQRMGIFSGPGVGKSTLLSTIAKNTSAEVSVVALIGERGREVPEFVHNSLGPEGLKRCVVIASTSDDPPLLRVRAARVACTIAEFFRDQGKDVLLLMDSLTRLAQAQRQIGLAAGEPPATRGFTPSVFALIPEILERAGNSDRGSVTGFYTVLVEGDDFNEPIPDAVKGVTDGHLWLSRALATRGQFPAVDVLQSISRVRGDVCEALQVQQARKVLSLLAMYQEIEDLVNIGAYVPGSNVDYDVAVQCRGKVIEFLKQEADAPCTLEQSRTQLAELVRFIDGTELRIRSAATKAAPRLQPPPPAR